MSSRPFGIYGISMSQTKNTLMFSMSFSNSKSAPVLQVEVSAYACSPFNLNVLHAQLEIRNFQKSIFHFTQEPQLLHQEDNLCRYVLKPPYLRLFITQNCKRYSYMLQIHIFASYFNEDSLFSFYKSPF